jgi:hypothetical protein
MQYPTVRHPLVWEASEFLDSCFFAPQEREMVQVDAMLHKHVTSPFGHSSSPIIVTNLSKIYITLCIVHIKNLIYEVIIFVPIFCQCFVHIMSSNMYNKSHLFDGA